MRCADDMVVTAGQVQRIVKPPLHSYWRAKLQERLCPHTEPEKGAERA
jgi:hypothetical protein